VRPISSIRTRKGRLIHSSGWKLWVNEIPRQSASTTAYLLQASNYFWRFRWTSQCNGWDQEHTRENGRRSRSDNPFFEIHLIFEFICKRWNCPIWRNYKGVQVDHRKDPEREDALLDRNGFLCDRCINSWVSPNCVGRLQSHDVLCIWNPNRELVDDWREV